MSIRTSAIILAGGSGERFGGEKCLISLNGKPVIQYALDVIEPFVDEVVIVAAREYGTHKTVKPGQTRQESVLNGLMACSSPKTVIVHDGARPFVSYKTMQLVMEAVEAGNPSVDVATKVIDGLIENGAPKSKEGYWLSHTPEAFNYKLLISAHNETKKQYQDDVTMLWEEYGIKPYIVEGDYLNQKLTFPSDLAYMEGALKFRQNPIDTVPNLIGKTFVVFGHSGDIGSACVRKLKERGAQCYLMQGRISDDMKLPDILYHGVIYAAGSYKDDIMDVNFSYPTKLLDMVHGRCNVVFLSSTAATYGRKQALYSASKAALNSMIESRHEELAKVGVYVNAIAPAKVKGKLQSHFGATEQGRFLETAEVADWVLKYLDTDAHGHIIYIRNS